ncbi:MAG TPA: transposase [Bradyrhizobium sp.]|nr:transposase [Bradyrhizobium sp.]
MTDATPLPFDLSAVRRKKLTVDFGGGNQSSNGGLLLLRNAERKLGVCGRLADAMPDRREASRIRHAMFELVMARVCAIACGHEDAIDLDRLRHDPLMKVAVGRCPQSGAPLASQSTISRLQNAPRKTEAAQPTAVLLDQFGTTIKPGAQEILDIDTFCAAHGGRR